MPGVEDTPRNVQVTRTQNESTMWGLQQCSTEALISLVSRDVRDARSVGRVSNDSIRSFKLSYAIQLLEERGFFLENR